MGFDVHMKWPNDLLRREEPEEGPAGARSAAFFWRNALPRMETPAENLLVAGIG
ncbi:MAG: hypothetical protein ACLR0N_14245 [Bilophila wadsworthia]